MPLNGTRQPRRWPLSGLLASCYWQLSTTTASLSVVANCSSMVGYSQSGQSILWTFSACELSDHFKKIKLLASKILVVEKRKSWIAQCP